MCNCRRIQKCHDYKVKHKTFINVNALSIFMTRINIRLSNELEHFEYNNSINNRYINSNIFRLYTTAVQVAFEPVKHSN